MLPSLQTAQHRRPSLGEGEVRGQVRGEVRVEVRGEVRGDR